MSETEGVKGKLYTEIEEKQFDYSNIDILPNSKVYVIDTDDLRKFLDEAKADFPKCPDCDFYVGDGEDGHCTLDDKVDPVGCPKDDWFRRWLGQ
jgi:hypothetical protein